MGNESPTVSVPVVGLPPQFANSEWGKYMVRQFYENQSRAAAAIGDEFTGGVVKFEPSGGRATRVTVELDVEPEPRADRQGMSPARIGGWGASWKATGSTFCGAASRRTAGTTKTLIRPQSRVSPPASDSVTHAASVTAVRNGNGRRGQI